MAELVYLDETGSVGRGARMQPFLTLVAVVVDESNVQPLASRLQGLALEHLGWIPEGFEFHGVEVWNGTGYWRGRTPTQRLEAFDAVIQVLSELSLNVVHSTIDKPALHAKYSGAFDSNAYLLALQFLLEKLDLWRTRQARRLLIADEAKEHELRAVKLVKDMQQWSTGLVTGRQLVSVIDSIHFVDSSHSPGVQLADMVAFAIHRSRLSHSHPDALAVVRRMRGVIDGCTPTWREPWP